MKNVEKGLKKQGSKLLAGALTKTAGKLSNDCCYFIYHQPKAPEGLRKFSK